MYTDSAAFKEVTIAGGRCRHLTLAGAVMRGIRVRKCIDAFGKVGELCRPGVYVLIDGPAGQNRPRVYVGLAGPGTVASRLTRHRTRVEWWAEAIALTRTDERLSAEAVQYLEDRLHDLFRQSGRYRVENGASTRRPEVACAFFGLEVEQLLEQGVAMLHHWGLVILPTRFAKSRWCEEVFHHAMAYLSAVGGAAPNADVWEVILTHVAGARVQVPANQLEPSRKPQYPVRLVHNFMFAICRARLAGLIAPTGGTSSAAQIALTPRGHEVAAEWRRQLGWPGTVL